MLNEPIVVNIYLRYNTSTTNIVSENEATKDKLSPLLSYWLLLTFTYSNFAKCELCIDNINIM